MNEYQLQLSISKYGMCMPYDNDLFHFFKIMTLSLYWFEKKYWIKKKLSWNSSRLVSEIFPSGWHLSALFQRSEHPQLVLLVVLVDGPVVDDVVVEAEEVGARYQNDDSV